jgi:hypothetical protein
VGKEKNKVEKVKRMVCILVDREQDEREVFCTAVASALCEYAGRIYNGVAGNMEYEQFTSSNGCKIKVVHGYESLKG